MNLNTLKRGFTRTNPEKGLRDLSGARRSERDKNRAPTVRVSGKYVPQPIPMAAKALGMFCYLLGWGSAIGMMVAVIAAESAKLDPLAEVFGVFVIGLICTHITALLAEAFRGEEAPWARKAIIVFWSSTLLSIAVAWIL